MTPSTIVSYVGKRNSVCFLLTKVQTSDHLLFFEQRKTLSVMCYMYNFCVFCYGYSFVSTVLDVLCILFDVPCYCKMMSLHLSVYRIFAGPKRGRTRGGF